MQYTTVISQIIKTEGNLNLPPSAMAKINNIIWLEGRIAELKSLKPFMTDKGLPNIFDLRLFERQNQLTEITHNLAPRELLERLAKNLPY